MIFASVGEGRMEIFDIAWWCMKEVPRVVNNLRLENHSISRSIEGLEVTMRKKRSDQEYCNRKSIFAESLRRVNQKVTLRNRHDPKRSWMRDLVLVLCSQAERAPPKHEIVAVEEGIQAVSL